MFWTYGGNLEFHLFWSYAQLRFPITINTINMYNKHYQDNIYGIYNICLFVLSFFVVSFLFLFFKTR
jgi:hypothetical protein